MIRSHSYSKAPDLFIHFAASHQEAWCRPSWGGVPTFRWQTYSKLDKINESLRPGCAKWRPPNKKRFPSLATGIWYRIGCAKKVQVLRCVIVWNVSKGRFGSNLEHVRTASDCMNMCKILFMESFKILHAHPIDLWFNQRSLCAVVVKEWASLGLGW